jgi:hypothetical protein
LVEKSVRLGSAVVNHLVEERRWTWPELPPGFATGEPHPRPAAELRLPPAAGGSCRRLDVYGWSMLEKSPDGLAELSSLLGVSSEELAGLLPTPVWSLPDNFAGEAAATVTWWLAAGDQVLAIVGIGIDTLVVGVPRIHWYSQDPVVELGSFECLVGFESEEKTRLWLSARVASVVHRRRSGFRRCHRCRNLLAPEWMFGGGICQVCAQDDGVVF